MKMMILFAGCLLINFAPLPAQSSDEPVDFTKARQLLERHQRGDTLTAAEKAYLERARAERGRAQTSPARAGAAEDMDWDKARALRQRVARGEKLTSEEDAYLKRALALRQTSGGRSGADRAQRSAGQRPAGQRPAPDRLIPLTDLGAQDRYEGQEGGLYGGGRNTPPDSLRRVAQTELAKIQPLNAEGKPDDGGLIGFVSISMSNATQEFSRFKQIADESPLKSSKVAIVDCAQGGQAMAEWAPPEARPWEEARRRLAAAGVSPHQVQVAWVKLANKAPAGSLDDHVRKLERDTIAVLQNAKAQFPNLRVAYLGSRIYAGNATGALNPEPYAYESAFAVRSLIQRQMEGAAPLALGKAPLLLWGPYLWAEGTRGRQIDSLIWERSDFAGDGVHPSQAGRQKVAELLLQFFTRNPLAKSWFAK